MLYDANGLPLPEVKPPAPPPAEGLRLVAWEHTDRAAADVSRGLTPAKLDGILTAANGGDPRAQANLAREILEKDWDAFSHHQTRVAAIKGTGWKVVPPAGLEKDTRAVQVADAVQKMLGRIEAKVTDLVGHLATGILPGYSLAEIMWGAGGRTVEDFAAVDAGMVSFNRSLQPLLISQADPMGRPLVPGKFVWHQVTALGGDPTRGHLIRTVSRLFLLKNTGIKDLARMIEKFGMPFVVGRVDQAAWDKDRSALANLIRNFGSDGGGLFSKGVEIEMLQAAQTDGEVFFRLLEYCGDAMAKVFLGQTATSGDGSGFNNGGAQTMVRRDILEGDCKPIERTITAAILEPWTLWNFGADAPVPQFDFELVDPVDMEAMSAALERTHKMGFRPRREAMEKLLGVELEDVPTGAQPQPTMLADTVQPADPIGAIADAAVRKLAADGAAAKWLAPLQSAIDEALAGITDEADATDEEEFRKRLARLLQGMPGLMESMDTRAVEDAIAGAMFAADANGRLAALQRVAGKEAKS